MRVRRALLLAGALTLLAGHALAQAHNPFGVGISEGGGPAGGVAGWLLAQQSGLERQLGAAVRAVARDGRDLPWLVGLSFGYGVFHAAGPGHGKAVIASYLFASERALRRGLVLSFLAALLQGIVAVTLVGVLALVLHGTAQHMRAVAGLVESLSFAGVACLGAWLVWRKGLLLATALADGRHADLGLSFGPAMALAGPAAAGQPAGRHGTAPALRFQPQDGSSGSRDTARRLFEPASGCDVSSTSLAHGPDCGHAHVPDPRSLGQGFSWRTAAAAVVTAGARPCSGAILVLVFAAAQGIFTTGVAAVAAMSLGTALTTGALAAVAVLARGAALRLTRPGSRRGLVALRGLEMGAGAVVLVTGLSLLVGSAQLGAG